MSESKAPQAMAGAGAILARRYAVALLDLAEEKGVTETVLADLTVWEDIVSDDPSFAFLSHRPQLRSSVVRGVVKAALEKAKMNPLTAAFLDRVARGRRLAHLGHMIAAFRAELAERRSQRTAYVTAAHPLTEVQEKALVAQLQKMMGGTVSLVVQEDKSLLGGLLVKIGSCLIDASVEGKLAQVERRLKTQREAA